MSFAVFGVTEPFSFSATVGGVAASSFLIVDVDVDLLLKPLVRGARCVSFNSTICQRRLRYTDAEVMVVLTLRQLPGHLAGLVLNELETGGAGRIVSSEPAD